jgi:predicted transcriptional regulator
MLFEVPCFKRVFVSRRVIIGISQKEAAKRAGVSLDEWRRIESYGTDFDNRFKNLRKWRRIASAIDVTVEKLVDLIAREAIR